MFANSVAKDAHLLQATDVASTLDLHRTNLLRLQAAELVEECRLDPVSRNFDARGQELFQLLAKLISGICIEEDAFLDMSDKPVSVKIRPPEEHKLLLKPFGCTRFRFGWTKRQGNAQVPPTLDWMVLIPSEIFSGKDYLHYRYFDKCQIVTKAVAEELQKRSHEIGKVDFVWINGSSRPPILQLQSQDPPKKSVDFLIHLHFGMDSISWIPSLRLVPNRSNCKETGPMAQLYNHCLLYCARFQFGDKHLRTLMDHQACHDALILLKIWALQRGLWRNHDGWDQNSVALLMVYLLRINKMNTRMTPVQIFTIVLQIWSDTDWLGENIIQKECPDGRNPLSVERSRRRTVLVMPSGCSSATASSSDLTLSELYTKQTKESPISKDDPPTLLELYSSTDCYFLGPVFLDPTMTYNYLGGVSPNYMKLLRCSAQSSLDALMQSKSAFEVLFMQQARFYQSFDLYFRIPSNKGSFLDWESSARNLTQILDRGLGARIRSIRVLSTGNGDCLDTHSNSDQFLRRRSANIDRWKERFMQSPTGTEGIVVGVSINAQESQRVVDRGPPSDQVGSVEDFKAMWGEKAQLRRFKDGAIVFAVVWDDVECSTFNNHLAWKGGHIEKIVRHLVKQHHGLGKVACCCPSFLSVVDGIISDSTLHRALCDPLYAHQKVLKAFENLSGVLIKNATQRSVGNSQVSAFGLPLSIDAVEPLSPCLRNSELFPPVETALFGGDLWSGKHLSGANMFDPILLQIRFGVSSKWPTDLTAIGAAKTAMLIQLAEGIERIGGRDFNGVNCVYPSHLDVGYQGFCFRILVRADPEILLLQRLETPRPSATRLLQDLTKQHIIGQLHHSMIQANHAAHPSSACVVRAAQRWIGSHLLSGHVGTDLIELLVAYLYSETSTAFAFSPATAVSGFLRFLDLLATHDWARRPLVVDPRGEISDEDYEEILQAFGRYRTSESGLAMYVVAPYDSYHRGMNGTLDKSNLRNEKWIPSAVSPEWVVLNRISVLAKLSLKSMDASLRSFNDTDWQAVFRETPKSFKTYSALLRMENSFVVDRESSSTVSNLKPLKKGDGPTESSFTRSIKAWSTGPKTLRQNAYRNLTISHATDSILPFWCPVDELVEVLVKRFGHYAVFFYNRYCPEVIALAWRPGVFDAGSFSSMTSERKCPVVEEWTAETLCRTNVGDLMREIHEFSKDFVTHVKVFDDVSLLPFSKRFESVACESRADKDL